ncbi:MAG: Sir2 family NAD-dependent protein deacetylase [Desulfobacterales bacterium]|nr:Sir2 family NAD-dependent protein deacetylase [Desulfobacterales bacterium]
MTVEHEIQKAAEIIANAKQAAASCGAGISAESGIATFRDPGGVWDKLNPAEVGTTAGLLNTLDRNGRKLIPFFIELLEAFEQSNPNPAHMALGALEEMGILKTVITQNIDNLHQEAGNTDVVEVHGNGFRLSCISCGKLKTRQRRELIAEIKTRIQELREYNLSTMATIMPKCDHCEALMRPDVVMFGEMVKDIPRAFDAARQCDAMLAIGTSGVVYPAAYLPFEAKDAGAPVIVVNPNENPFSRVSDAYIPMNAGTAMPKLVEAVRAIKGA